MRKLTEKEFESLTPITNGRETMVTAAVKQLAVGEGLVITRAEWKAKEPPYKAINRIAKKYNRLFEKGRMPDGSGWAVKRTG